jgi:DNA modification methylase
MWPPPDIEYAYVDESVALVQGDCMEILPQLQAESIDLVLTDPPFGLNYNTLRDMASRREAIFQGTTNGAPRPIQGDSRADFEQGMKEWFPAFKRVLKRGGCCCCCCCGGGGPQPIFAEMTLAMDACMEFLQAVVWAKPGLGMGLRYRRSYEFMLIAKKAGAALRWNNTSKDVSNVVDFRKIIPAAHQHPTAKPETLMSHFIQLHSFPDDIVLDPFAGHGPTLRAAKDLGRKAIGIELDEDHIPAIVQRLQQETLAFGTTAAPRQEAPKRGTYHLQLHPPARSRG